MDSGLALDLLAYHTTPLGTAEQRTMTDLEQTYRHRWTCCRPGAGVPGPLPAGGPGAEPPREAAGEPAGP